VRTETDELIDIEQACRMAGLSRTQAWRKVKAGTFPQPIRLGTRCTRYSLQEVSEWIRRCLRERADVAEVSR
jgi:prophage regulatory protein